MNAIRIAMWSGPRNISTAMMRAWGSRPQTIVCDEPFYAHYLAETGLAHPGRDEVIAAHETDWHKVVEWLTGPLPADATVFYQKHMAHHFLPHMRGDWLNRLSHAFLIRDPAAMLVSLDRVYPDPTATDTGLPQQLALFEHQREQSGVAPPVIDARDVLKDPRRMLHALCTSLDLEFNESMLSWEPGARASDGVWAKFWYDAVNESTGFMPYREKHIDVPARLDHVLSEIQPIYDQLYSERLRP